MTDEEIAKIADAVVMRVYEYQKGFGIMMSIGFAFLGFWLIITSFCEPKK